MLIFKKVLLLFVLFITSFFTSFSQCNPDFIYTSVGLPGVYPPSIQIPNLPVPTGISEGYIGENYNQTISHKLSKNELTEYFRQIVPDFDEEKVYISDIKKVIQWYNLLQSKKIIKRKEEKKKK